MKNKWLVFRVFVVFLTLPGWVSIAQDEQGIDNLVAFTRLVGYVRYFHPADTVASTDWDTFAAAHVDTIMSAENDGELIDVLNVLFAPYAPTLQIYAPDEAPDLPEALTDSASATGIVQWVHVPVVSSTAGSGEAIPEVRVVLPLENGAIPAEFTYTIEQAFGSPTVTLPTHTPAEPYVVALTESITARIPLTLYVGEDTAPVTLPELDAPNITGDTLQGRLVAVMAMWNYFQHFFSYWPVLEEHRAVDWNAALREALQAAMSDENAGDFYFTLRRLAAHLHDGHMSVIPSRQAISILGAENIFGRAGFPFTWDIVDGQLTVTTLLAEDTQGIHVGDVITEIDGQPVMDKLAEWDAMTSPYGDFGVFMILAEWQSGAAGSTVRLTVDPADGGASYTTDIERTTTLPQDDLYRREPRPDTVAQLSPGIIYVDLTRLNGTEYNAALDLLADADGLVFDVRGYPTSTAINILGHLRGENLRSAPFLVPVVVTPDHREIHLVDLTADDWIRGKTPVLTDNVAFIINGNGAVSYAESLMGIVEGYQLGELVGSATAGANGNFASVQLPGDYVISYTSLHVTRFDESPLFTFGIAPTIPAARTREGVIANRDELLEVAFATVGGTALEMIGLHR